MELLNNIQLEEILKHDVFTNKIFNGVYARDMLPKYLKYPSAIIVNTDKSNLSGQHWLAIYFDKDKNCEFFDSFGRSPKYYKFENYIKKHADKVKWNKKQIQGFNSSICGYYCVLFLLLKARNHEIRLFLKNFDKNYDENDKYILKLIK